MKRVKKSALRIFGLRVLVKFVALLPDCWLENKLILLIFMNFPIKEISKVLDMETELNLLPDAAVTSDEVQSAGFRT